MFRIAGLRPFSRSKELDYSFSVTSSDGSASVSASLDGKPLLLTPDSASNALTGDLRLNEVGWHELVIESDGASRTVLMKRLPGD